MRTIFEWHINQRSTQSNISEIIYYGHKVIGIEMKWKVTTSGT